MGIEAWIALSALLSVGLVLIDGLMCKEEKNQLLIDCAFFGVIAAIVFYGICLVAGNRYTRYEYLGIVMVAVVLVRMLVLFFIRNKKMTINQILKTNFCVACVVVAYSIMTCGRSCIHSDTATATILAKSIVRHHSLFPETWCYANGDIWTIGNHLLCIFTSKLFADQSIARAVTSLICVLFVCVGVIYQSRKVFQNSSWVISIPILMVFLFGLNDMILYQAAYTSQITWITVSTTLLYEICKTDNSKRTKIISTILYGLLIFLLMMGGIRCAAELVLPMICALLVLFFIDLQKSNKAINALNIKKIVCIIIVIIVPALLGYVAYKWLCSWHNVNNTVNNALVLAGSLQEICENIKYAVVNMFACFGYTGGVELISINGVRNFISITVCIVVCFIVPIFQGIRFKDESEGVQFFLLFSAVHNAIMLLMVVFLGKITDRYMLTSVFVYVLVSSRYVYVYWINGKEFRRYIWVTLFVAATAIETIGLCKTSAGWSQKIAEQKNFNNILVECGVTKAYGSYWNTYKNEIYSNLKIRYGALLSNGGITLAIDGNGVQPFLWLVDSEVFDPKSNINSALVLSEQENEDSKDYITQIFGEPREHITVNGIHAYIFENDIAENFNY